MNQSTDSRAAPRIVVKRRLSTCCRTEITFINKLFDIELKFFVVSLLNVRERGGERSHQGRVTTAIGVIHFAESLVIASRQYP
jgi:hypothetical protein